MLRSDQIQYKNKDNVEIIMKRPQTFVHKCKGTPMSGKTKSSLVMLLACKNDVNLLFDGCFWSSLETLVIASVLHRKSPLEDQTLGLLTVGLTSAWPCLGRVLARALYKLNLGLK